MVFLLRWWLSSGAVWRVRSYKRQQHAATLWACGQNGPRELQRVTLGKGSGAGAPCSGRARGRLAGGRSLLSGGGGAHSGSRGARACSRAGSHSLGCVTERKQEEKERRFWPKGLQLLALRRLLHPSFSNTAAARSLARPHHDVDDDGILAALPSDSFSLSLSLILARHSQKQDEKEPLMGGWIIDGCAAGWPAGRSAGRGRLVPMRERADCAHTSMGEKLFCFRHMTPSESGHWPRKGSEPKAPIRASLLDVCAGPGKFVCSFCTPICSCLFKSASIEDLPQCDKVLLWEICFIHIIV